MHMIELQHANVRELASVTAVLGGLGRDNAVWAIVLPLTPIGTRVEPSYHSDFRAGEVRFRRHTTFTVKIFRRSVEVVEARLEERSDLHGSG